MTTVMKRSKIEAFYLEFPWLETIVKICPRLWITVQRIDLELFRRKRHGHTEDCFFSDYVIYDESIYVFDQNGVRLGRLGYRDPVEVGFWSKFVGVESESSIHSEKTLEDLFERLGSDSEKVQYVVSIKDNNDEGRRDIIIYKAPRDMSIRDYIEMEIQKAREEIQKDIEEIDG